MRDLWAPACITQRRTWRSLALAVADFNGDGNPTLRTIGALARALGAELRLSAS